MAFIKLYLARIDELTLRERVIIISGVLLLLFLGCYAYLLEPLTKEGKSLQEQLLTKRNRLQDVNVQFEQLAQRQRLDPDATNRALISELRQQQQQVDQELLATTAYLVPPEEMPGILREVVNKSRGLSLLSLQGLGSSPVTFAEQTGATDDDVDGGMAPLFRHGMQIEFSGGFEQTLEFIRALEQLPWKFFWDRIDYRVAEYPQATVSITLYTLSLNGEWIRI